MHVHVQIVTDDDTPAPADIIRWAQSVDEQSSDDLGELTVRIVGPAEAARLNLQWRNRSEATNVLAFPLSDENMAASILGDVVICAEVANREAERDKKLRDAHWAHLVIHGTLHLLGYDHADDADAATMEALECTKLRNLGYPNPYL